MDQESVRLCKEGVLKKSTHSIHSISVDDSLFPQREQYGHRGLFKISTGFVDKDISYEQASLRFKTGYIEVSLIFNVVSNTDKSLMSHQLHKVRWNMS